MTDCKMKYSACVAMLLVAHSGRVWADDLCEAAKDMPAFYASPDSKVIKLTRDKFDEQVIDLICEK